MTPNLEQDLISSGYVRYDTIAGTDLKEVVLYLILSRRQGKKIFTIFNGTYLISDNVSLDSAYQEICGCSYEEHLVKSLELQAELLDREKSRKKVNQEKLEEYLDKGKQILPKRLWDSWEKTASVRVEDIYEGAELDAALEIIKALKEGCSLSYAKDIINNQNHSGTSFSLTRSLVREFSSRGKEFADYVK